MNSIASYMTKKTKQKLGLLLLTLSVSNVSLAHIESWMQLDQIERELASNIDDVPLLIDKAHALIQMGLLNDAEVTLQRIDDLESVRSADSTYVHILLYLSLGEDKKAFELSDWGIQKYPDNYYQWYIRAMLANKAEKLSTAIEAINKCLSIDEEKDPYGNYTLLVRLLLLRNGKEDKETALAALNKRVVKTSNRFEASHLLKMSISINKDLKRYDNVINDIASLEKLHGKQIPYEIDRAEIFELAGRYKEAIEAYDRAISMLNVLPEEKQNQQTDELKDLYIKDKAALQAKLKP